MKLYFAKGACSLVVRIILNEIDVAFEAESVDLRAKTCHQDKDYRKINPKGAVPALELDNGEVLTENAVILQYLANTYKRHDLLPAASDFPHYRVLEWLNFITTELHKGFSPLFNPAIPEEIKDQIIKPGLKTKFSYINQSLQQHKFLCEEHFSLPDAYLYVMVRWAVANKIDLENLSHLASYLHRLNQHPSIKKSLEEELLPPISLRVTTAHHHS